MTTGEALSQKLEQWLKAVGFVKGNPFATINAEDERAFLPECFVDTGHYFSILGNPQKPQTTLVLAPRGCGKTAYRVMLEQQCYPQGTLVNALAVPYLTFDPLFEDQSLTLRERLHCHLSAILRRGLQAIADTTARYPEMLHHVTPTQLQTLSSLQQRYTSSSTAPGSPAQQPLEDFTAFVRLVRWMGLDSVYVLVDRLDEQPETADDPQAVIDLILPLLAHLPLMELRGAAFKFFLPLTAEMLLQSAPKVRLDRLRRYWVEWDEALLSQLLEKRLIIFSEGHIKSLGQLALSPLSETIDRDLIQWANGSPRQLLRLGELLLLEHAGTMQGDTLLLAPEAREGAFARFQHEFPPPRLRIDPLLPRARIGARLIELTPLEHKFLLALHQSRGWCEKEALILKVWDTTEGVTDQAVSRLVRRIREKIEPLPGAPIYLLTEHNQGFRLEYLEEPQAP